MGRSHGLIVIPAYNEQKTLQEIIIKCLDLKNWDVLVVNDASTDNTGLIAKEHPVDLIENYTNLGYEASINIGYKFAISKKYNYLSFLDADGEHNPDCLIDFEFQKETPLIKIGIRSWHNRPGERIAGFLSSYLHGIIDPYCGLKSYNLKALKNRSFKSLPGDKIGTALALEIKKSYGKDYIENIKIFGTRRRGSSRFSNSSLSTNIIFIKNILF